MQGMQNSELLNQKQQEREILIEQTWSEVPSNPEPVSEATMPMEGLFLVPICIV